jgi:hypothetical protein
MPHIQQAAARAEAWQQARLPERVAQDLAVTVIILAVTAARMWWKQQARAAAAGQQGIPVMVAMVVTKA